MILKGFKSFYCKLNWKREKEKQIINFYLSEKKPQIVFIPEGYVHGTQI